MLSRFWSDSFWLPSNVTWEDISNGPGKAVVYAEVEDFWVTVPLVVLILLLRFLCERLIFVPLGKYLNINYIKVKEAAHNVRLEAEYQKSSKCENTSSLAKQLDLTERQVERWWRLRRRQDKPTTLVKFCENMWKGCCFLSYLTVGLITVWGQDWARDANKCFVGHPHQGITPGIWWFYMLASSFYVSLIITHSQDARRKDFWPMFFHHINTIVLLFLSWTTQYFRIGCLVIILHDGVEIFLDFGKALKYAKYHRTVDCILAAFFVVWVGLRLVLFPFFVLPAAYSQHSKSPINRLLSSLLVLVLLLTFYWSWLIAQMVVRAIRSGGMAQDIRSSESEDDDVTSSQTSNEAPTGTSSNRKKIAL